MVPNCSRRGDRRIGAQQYRSVTFCRRDVRSLTEKEKICPRAPNQCVEHRKVGISERYAMDAYQSAVKPVQPHKSERALTGFLSPPLGEVCDHGAVAPESKKFGAWQAL